MTTKHSISDGSYELVHWRFISIILSLTISFCLKKSYYIILCWVFILLTLSIAGHSKWTYPPCDSQHQDMACLRLFYFFLCCIPQSNFPSSDALYFQIPIDSCTGPLQRSYSVWWTVEFPSSVLNVSSRVIFYHFYFVPFLITIWIFFP